MTILLRFFPNGEFSQGVVASSKRPSNHVCKTLQTSIQSQIYTNADLRRCNEQNADIPAQAYARTGCLLRCNGGTVYRLDSVEPEKTVLLATNGFYAGRTIHVDTSIYRLVHLKLLIPLGSSDARILTEPSSSRKKLTQMTRNMGRNLRNAVYLLEERYGKEQLSFLTLTLPNLSRGDLALCCANWDVMVNTFFKWLRTKLEMSLLELEYVYCTEIQPGRLRNRGEYAPHLHVVFRGRSRIRSPWAIAWLDCRNAWAECIRKHTTADFDTRALENIQGIKKSAARYLSKYLSKGKNLVPQGMPDDAPLAELHTQWGGMSRNLSRAIKKRMVRLSGINGNDAFCMSLLRHMQKAIDVGIVKYFKGHFISLGICRSTGKEVGLHVGVGCLSSPTDIALHKLFEFIYSLCTD